MGKKCISVYWGFGMRKVETKIYSFSNHLKCNHSICAYGKMGATTWEKQNLLTVKKKRKNERKNCKELRLFEECR